MTILVTGEAGLIRRSIIDALLRGPHRVRLFAPDATTAANDWPAHVEPRPFAYDASEPLAEACRGCEAVVLLENAASESPAASRDARGPGVAVSDIRRIVDAAATAEVGRLLYVTARRDAGPDGQGGEAERVVRAFPREWLIIHHGAVYGPGDPIISRALILMRSLPVVPLTGGSHRLQPLWHGDLADAVVIALESPRVDAGQVIPLVGPDSITVHDLYDHIALLIDRRPPRIPVPEFLSTYGSRVAELLHVPGALVPSLLMTAGIGMSHVFPTDAADNLSRVFGIQATSLDEGLMRLANEGSEQMTADGVGAIEIKRFWADIRDSQHTASSLMRLFKVRFNEIMPIPFGVEPASPNNYLGQGLTLTARMPLRGHVQVRVEEATDRQVTLATLQGHPLSGIVRFTTEDVADGVHFEVMTCDRAANAIDWIIFSVGGGQHQSANWREVVRRVVEASGGSGQTQHTVQKLTEEEAAAVDATIGAFVQRRRPPATHRAGR